MMKTNFIEKVISKSSPMVFNYVYNKRWPIIKIFKKDKIFDINTIGIEDFIQLSKNQDFIKIDIELALSTMNQVEKNKDLISEDSKIIECVKQDIETLLTNRFSLLRHNVLPKMKKRTFFMKPKGFKEMEEFVNLDLEKLIHSFLETTQFELIKKDVKIRMPEEKQYQNADHIFVIAKVNEKGELDKMYFPMKNVRIRYTLEKLFDCSKNESFPYLNVFFDLHTNTNELLYSCAIMPTPLGDEYTLIGQNQWALGFNKQGLLANYFDDEKVFFYSEEDLTLKVSELKEKMKLFIKQN